MDKRKQANSKTCTGHRRIAGWGRWGRFATSGLVVAAATTMWASAGLSRSAGQSEGPDIDGARTALEQWVQTRQQISKTKQDWRVQKEMLDERINLVQSEITSVRKKIKKIEQNIAETDQERQAKLAENRKFKEATSALEQRVTQLEARTRKMLQRMPPPLRESVKPLSNQFPDKPEDTELSLSKRFQNIVGILNQANKFNTQITRESETRQLDGRRVNVTVLYLGVSQAFYVNADATVGGIGTVSKDGWVWKPVNEAAPQIADAVAIYENEKVASFVKLPVEIQ
jgi:septal ring factor EnvC (AmiA/AmiB activator)